MRTRTENVTLSTWTLRVDGQDVTDIELDSSDVSGVRQMVADATGQRVSLGLTANMRGILLCLRGDCVGGLHFAAGLGGWAWCITGRSPLARHN